MNLADLFSAIDSFKRKASDTAANPLLAIQQQLGQLNDNAGQHLQDLSAATQEGMQYGPATQKVAQALAQSYNPAGIYVGDLATKLEQQLALQKSVFPFGADTQARREAIEQNQALLAKLYGPHHRNWGYPGETPPIDQLQQLPAVGFGSPWLPAGGHPGPANDIRY